MNPLPETWTALCCIVFLLGMRHGLDADHLATIDGLTRLAGAHSRGFARFCGVLFSIGHGLVVLLIAGSVGFLSLRWTPPQWLNAFGAWISIGFLLFIGIANLKAMFQAPAGSIVRLSGIKGSFLSRLLSARSPWRVAAVGSLFALSFDTVSQSALFGAAATRHGGMLPALMLGTIFLLGMLLTDGLNGWWISRLLARADHVAARASRAMSAAVAGVSLLVAGLGIARLLTPSLDAWGPAQELTVSAIVMTVLASSYVAARALSRPEPAPALGS